MRAFIGFGLAVALVACDRTDSQNHVAVSPVAHVPQGGRCPDITGTFAFPPHSPAVRFLVGERWANQGFSLLRIESTADGNSYVFTAKASREAFEAAADRLAQRDAAKHGEWEDLLRERARVIEARLSRDVLDAKIAAIGPLPDLMRVIGRRSCADYWAEVGIDLDANKYADVIEPKPGARYDLELWFARNAAGDLVYRFDRYRIRGVTVPVRIERSRHLDRIEAIGHDAFEWTPDLGPEPAPPEVVPRAALTSFVAGISQTLMASMPPGAEMTRFAPRDIDAVQGATPTLVIDVSGVAARASDVSDIMRSVHEAAGVSSIELVSLRMNAANRMEFELMVSVQAPR